MKDSDPPPPYCSSDQGETENVVSTAFGATVTHKTESMFGTFGLFIE